jgi:hypothetical protein
MKLNCMHQNKNWIIQNSTSDAAVSDHHAISNSRAPIMQLLGAKFQETEDVKFTAAKAENLKIISN